MTPLILDAIDQPETWELVAWMTERSADWVLIGGLMVATFDVEFGHAWRPTEDIDSLFDVRHAPRGAIRSHVAELREAGFEFVLGREPSAIACAAAISSSTYSRPNTSPPKRFRHREAGRQSNVARSWPRRSAVVSFSRHGRTCSARRS